MVIYCIKNKVNDKCYIGQTIQNFKKRKGAHLSLLKRGKHANTYLQNAWNKYGEENFKWVVLEEGFGSIKELNQAEEFWISYLRTYIYEYNLTKGGKNEKGYKFTEEHKEKISKALRKYTAKYNKKGELLEIYDSIKEASLINDCHKGWLVDACKIPKASCAGFMWRSSKTKNFPNQIEPYGEYKERISKHKTRKILQYDLDGNFIDEYDSMKEAVDVIDNKSARGISACCRNVRNKAGGYQWCYWEENFPKKIEKYKPQKSKFKRVHKLDTEGNILDTYESVKSAAKDVGLKNPTNISAVLKGRNKTSMGYDWKYVD